MIRKRWSSAQRNKPLSLCRITSRISQLTSLLESMDELSDPHLQPLQTFVATFISDLRVISATNVNLKALTNIWQKTNVICNVLAVSKKKIRLCFSQHSNPTSPHSRSASN